MARFTEHQGDPAWLKSQREAQARMRVAPTRRPSAAPTPVVVKASPQQFVTGAKQDSQLGTFIMGAVVGAVLAGRRR